MYNNILEEGLERKNQSLCTSLPKKKRFFFISVYLKKHDKTDCVSEQFRNETCTEIAILEAGCLLKLFPKQALVFTCMQYKSFENIVGKGEIARNEQFLPFPQCFIPVWRTFSNEWINEWMVRQNERVNERKNETKNAFLLLSLQVCIQCIFFEQYKSQKQSTVSTLNYFHPFSNKPWFLRFSDTSLLKTLWEKEKLIVTSNFSFPTVFSTHLANVLPFSPHLKLSSANSFSLEEFKICRLGKC